MRSAREAEAADLRALPCSGYGRTCSREELARNRKLKARISSRRFISFRKPSLAAASAPKRP